MGVYYGLIMLAIAFWFHASVIKENEPLPQDQKENAFKWFALGAACFFAGILFGSVFNWVFVTGILGGMAIGIGSEFGEASGGNTGMTGILLELSPLAFGLLFCYLVRLKFILKKSSGISAFIKGTLEKIKK